MKTNKVVNGDSLEVLDTFAENSFHAIVTDPPYGLAFMGRDWDSFEPKEYQEWCEKWARNAKRVLKPGGHLLAFSGNRTHHRLFTGVEDAGFEIRDTLTYHFGSGFPKASDISKTIDKREGAEREAVGVKYTSGDHRNGVVEGGSGNGVFSKDETKVEETEPATDAAKEWDGWKTGLKPATEFIVMARKPFDGATVDSVLEHGTGALNIDATRIGTEERTNQPTAVNGGVYGDTTAGENNGETVEGRYPANVIFDETEAERLDERVGKRDDGEYQPRSGNRTETQFDPEDGWNDHNMDPSNANAPDSYGGKGGPSRYFYTSKATKSERTLDDKIDNAHPTVKPQDLMEWLVKLVTKENQIVLDPFAGSGTTLMAAKELHRQFIGIEKQEKWADVARVRVGLEPEDWSHIRGEDAQDGLEKWQ